MLRYDEMIFPWEQFRAFENFVQSVIDLLCIARKERELLMTCEDLLARPSISLGEIIPEHF